MIGDPKAAVIECNSFEESRLRSIKLPAILEDVFADSKWVIGHKFGNFARTFSDDSENDLLILKELNGENQAKRAKFFI